jgi:ribosomal protein L11 methyltransferase
MSWVCATVVVDRNLAEPFSDALMEAGALTVDISDADAGTPDERPIFDEPGGAPAAQWSRARVAALFTHEVDVPHAVNVAFEQTAVSADTAYDVAEIEDKDWVRLTQAQFTPIEAAPGLWVVPSWHAPPDPDALNIMLDPGLAFGTGTHPTTRLCLRWLLAHVHGGDSLIDFGCGSGILGIAAAKLGATRVHGVDIDMQAVTAAQDNALRNNVVATFVPAADRLPGPAQIVVANILAQPLIVLAPVLAELTLPAGRIALSGILTTQASEVRAAFVPWYDFEPDTEEEGWVLLSGTRQSPPGKRTS